MCAAWNLNSFTGMKLTVGGSLLRSRSADAISHLSCDMVFSSRHSALAELVSVLGFKKNTKYFFACWVVLASRIHELARP